MDLSKYGGAYNGALIDSAVQEYNLKTGRLAAQLGRARSHPAERVRGLAADQRLPVGRLPRQLDRLWPATGTFLVSMRNTWAAYLVDGASGRIEWTLGGTRLELQVRPGAALPVAARRAAAGRLARSRCSTTTAAS